MKFADEHFNKVKAGDILIFISEDDDFTKGAEYVVQQDDEGLFIVDDGQYEQMFNEVLARDFALKNERDIDIVEKALELACKYISEYSPGLICEPVRDMAYFMQKARSLM
jgi:hypothetical protein